MMDMGIRSYCVPRVSSLVEGLSSSGHQVSQTPHVLLDQHPRGRKLLDCAICYISSDVPFRNCQPGPGTERTREALTDTFLSQAPSHFSLPLNPLSLSPITNYFLLRLLGSERERRSNRIDRCRALAIVPRFLRPHPRTDLPKGDFGPR